MIKQISHSVAITVFLGSLVLTACNQEKLSFDSVESGRKQANENSLYNANAYRAAHKEYAGWSISSASDSTQSASCGQGDGWATLSLTTNNGQQKAPIKCSTVSEALGCMTDAEFKEKSYASQDGRCDDAIPFPLPKIQK